MSEGYVIRFREVTDGMPIDSSKAIAPTIQYHNIEGSLYVTYIERYDRAEPIVNEGEP